MGHGNNCDCLDCHNKAYYALLIRNKRRMTEFGFEETKDLLDSYGELKKRVEELGLENVKLKVERDASVLKKMPFRAQKGEGES